VIRPRGDIAEQPPFPARPRGRGLLKLLMLILVIVLGNLATGWFVELLDFQMRVSTEPTIHRIIMSSAGAFVVLLALPFVPGVEIGMALLFMLGPKIAPLVYGCTLTALCLSFLAGRCISERWLINFLRDLRLSRAAALITRFEDLDGRERLELMVSAAPRRLVPLLIRYRYLALLILINLPGNIVLGGGGGIALLAGMSRIFSVHWYLATVAIAIAPVPLALVLFGERFFEWPL
jgi:hypothetical protein